MARRRRRRVMWPENCVELPVNCAFCLLAWMVRIPAPSLCKGMAEAFRDTKFSRRRVSTHFRAFDNQHEGPELLLFRLFGQVIDKPSSVLGTCGAFECQQEHQSASLEPGVLPRGNVVTAMNLKGANSGLLRGYRPACSLRCMSLLWVDRHQRGSVARPR